METDLRGHTKSLAQDTGSLGQGKGSHGMLSQWKREGPVYCGTRQGQKKHAELERLCSSGNKSWTSQTDPRPPRRTWPPAQINSKTVRKLRQGNELRLCYYFFLLGIMAYLSFIMYLSVFANISHTFLNSLTGGPTDSMRSALERWARGPTRMSKWTTGSSSASLLPNMLS